MDDYKYVVYAVANYGDGMVQSLGEYDCLEDVIIHVGHFNKDVQITIEKQYEKDNN
jgi:diphthamide synthase subunit DPH2